MISYLERNDIDIVKYNNCISKAINSRVYAFSWYLDTVTDNWGILVLNDYEAVMPLPWRRKYYLKYIYLADWIQQLGVFYQEKQHVDIEDFINAIPKKFLLTELFFNSDNKGYSLLNRRTNYILNLNYKYQELFKEFSKGRKSNIKKTEKLNIAIANVKNASKLITLFKIEKRKVVKKSDISYSRLENLVAILCKKNAVKIFEVYHNEILLGGAIFIIDAYRITYLFSVTTKKGRKLSIISLLVNNIIKEYADSKLIFDFEGSMIKDIALFFKSFGAKKEYYSYYKKYQLPIFL